MHNKPIHSPVDTSPRTQLILSSALQRVKADQNAVKHIDLRNASLQRIARYSIDRSTESYRELVQTKIDDAKKSYEVLIETRTLVKSIIDDLGNDPHVRAQQLLALQPGAVDNCLDGPHDVFRLGSNLLIDIDKRE